jgi:hypothetical protein
VGAGLPELFTGQELLRLFMRLSGFTVSIKGKFGFLLNKILPIMPKKRRQIKGFCRLTPLPFFLLALPRPQG